MRCPKCHYLSFEPDPRCKNCGYDLDIDVDTDDSDDGLELRMTPVETAAPADLPLRSAQEPARPVTLELVHAAAPAARRPAPVPSLPPLAPVAPLTMTPVAEPAIATVAAVAEPEPARRAPARSATPTTELPLFVKTMGPQELGAFAAFAEVEATEEDEATEGAEDTGAEDTEADYDAVIAAPPVQLPPAMRPLSVRRPVETARAAPRIERRPGPIDHDLLEDLQRLEREEAIRAQRRPMTAAASTAGGLHTYLADDLDGSGAVAISQRLGAAAFDGLLLGGIGAFILWATLKVADASPSSLGVAALVPMGVFVVAVGVAYLLMFTAAGGQTVGKMLMGIRVVNENDSAMDGDRVTLGQAAGRAILAPLSVAMLGLGWLPAVFGRGQALHDRLVHTRVVRA